MINWRSTKFLQTSFVLIASSILVGVGVIDGLAYGSVTTLALGNYAHHDVAQKKVNT